MHYVIIGAGPAGIVAAETLRKRGRDADITVIGDEPEPPYARMALPYYLLNAIDESGTYLRKTQHHFQHQNIHLLQARVEQIDPRAHELQLDSGQCMSYDKLLIATGSRPSRPPITGIDLPGVFSCWTLQDARNIAQRIFPGVRVVLIGAGFIGCILLEALVKKGAALTIIESADRMVARMMNASAGRLIKQWCIDKGIQVLTQTQVNAIECSGTHELLLSLDKGLVLEAEMVILATGVQPNVGFLQGSSIQIEQGILIDQHMQTNIADIYAAGDVAQGLDFSSGDFSVQAIQPTAVEHGRIAALNMTGSTSAYQGAINMNVLDTLGLVASSFGLWQGVADGDSAELCCPERYQYLQLQFQEDYLVGAISLGLTQHVGVLRGLIQGRVKLGRWKSVLQNDPSRVMEAWLGNRLVFAS